nr:MAG TPA: hypothetical protein [Caudoviricetes sp.]DAT07329.1 MAG TPA: hypothetical protein [Caudoviricetes sp.]
MILLTNYIQSYRCKCVQSAIIKMLKKLKLKCLKLFLNTMDIALVIVNLKLKNKEK